MDTLFTPNLINDRDPEQNVTQLNALFLNLISEGAEQDNQAFALKQYFADFYHRARFSLENTFEKFLSASPITLSPSRSFMRWVESMPYADTIQYRAEIPEGMKVTYLEYLKVLIPAQTYANDINSDLIDPFSKFVSKMVTDQIFRNQVGHQIKEFLALEPQYEKINKGFESCFNKNDYKASAAFGEVVRRTGDWHTVFEETAVLKELYQKFPNQELTRKLNVLYDMLDKLVDQVKLDGYDKVEKEVSHLLSNGMYFVAKMVEQAAVTTFRSRTFIETINTTIKNVQALPNFKN